MSSPTPQDWTYTGRRHSTDRRIVYAWLDPDGTQRLFRAVAGGVVGGSYTVNAEIDDDGCTVIGKPVYCGRNPDVSQDELTEWAAKDRIAANREASRKQEKRDKDLDPIREALLPLRRVMHGRLSRNDKYALVAAIQAEMWRPLTKAEQEA